MIEDFDAEKGKKNIYKVGKDWLREKDVQSMKKKYIEAIDKFIYSLNFNIKEMSLKQQDYLRCTAYLSDPEKMRVAIDQIKKHPKCRLVRIKNRVESQGDIMVNFWYDETCIGEI